MFQAISDRRQPVAPVPVPPDERPPVDVAKVDRLRRAIRLGTYRVDPAAIAAKMIDDDEPA